MSDYGIHSVIKFLRSNAPAMRARRYFWIKLVVICGLIAILAVGAVVSENWFRSHQFAGAITAIVLAVSVIALGAA